MEVNPRAVLECLPTPVYPWPSYAECAHLNTGNIPIKKAKKKIKDKKISVKSSLSKKKNIFIPYNRVLPAPTFKINNGPRLFIPSKLDLSQSEKLKFDIVNLHNPRRRGFSSALFDIKTKYTFSFNNDKAAAFLKLPEISKYMQQSYKKEEYEWNKVKRLFLKLFKIKHRMQIICRRWIYRKCMKNIINTEDVVTMEVPKKPVYVINIERRCSYVYEASTLRKSINNRLLSCDYMFATPLYPLNILSNEEFTYMQSVSIYNQLKDWGACSWALERFKVYGFNLKMFETKCSQQLKLSAIDNHFYSDNDLLFETVYDYFTLMADFINIDEFYIAAFKSDFFNTNRRSSYIKAWISLTRRKYISQVTCDINEIQAVGEESGKLLAKVYSVYQDS
jgi:hypothetical protein